SPANQAAGLYYPKYEASIYIESTTPLASGEELFLDAGTEIRLKPGFNAAYGSDFTAWIDGCGGKSLAGSDSEDGRSYLNNIFDETITPEEINNFSKVF